MSVLSMVVAGLVTLAHQHPAPMEAPRPIVGVQLEYQFEKGDILRMEVTETSRLLAAKGEARQEQSNRSTTENRYVVTAVSPEGIATLRYRIVATRMRGQFGDNPPVEFDTRKEKTPPAFEAIRKSVGVDRWELDVKSDGTIVEVRSLVDGKTPSQGSQGQHQGTTKPSIFPPLPGKTVKVGDEWTRLRTMRVSVGKGLNSRLTQEVQILHTYRLTAIEQGVATIQCKSAPLTAINDPTIQVQVAPQKSTGTIRFDVARGRVLEQTKQVNNLTIGWQGPDSSLKTVQTRTERLLPPQQAVSARQ